MTSFAELLQQGAGHAWLFVPSAILLGALHGLEPGHSKTMMAAFIVAIRGTVAQAALLGLAATVSHTAVVWAVALIGMRLGGTLNAERTEPYFQLASAVLIVGVALWMLWRTWREQQRERLEADSGHGHGHTHGHAHDHGDHGHDDHAHDEIRRIDTGQHQVVLIEVFEDGVPPCFRLRFENTGRELAPPPIEQVLIETTRPGGATQKFFFMNRGTFLESIETIPEPHEFTARLRLGHGDHHHDYDVEFEEHGHAHQDHGVLDLAETGYQDAHERAHANDIQRRFANRNISTGQIVLFGLTGGLVPCPASITVLLLCLQLKQVSLGVVLVLCFSIGLAITMVASGTMAALSVRHAATHWSGFGALARRAPYASSALIIIVGLYTGYLGWHGLVAQAG
ncbi:MAG TPA: nickel/cobalt efflux transporter, partial [Xanthomonadaceae bacterium]|nr:nickel/cobalt efflux transporter [Xanthomonadaceae bacterium]